MSALEWVITMVGMAVGLSAVAVWVSGAGGPVADVPVRCGAVHPVLNTVCVRGIAHEVVDVHMDAAQQVWFDDEDPIRSCIDDTKWEGRPWHHGR